MRDALTLVFFGSLIAVLAGCKAQPTHTAVRIPDGETEILVGSAALDSLENAPFKGWYEANIEAYQADPELTASLEGLLEDVEIKLFLGTWCNDSRREVPRFVRILREAGYPEETVEVIAMTREKTTPEAFEEGFGIINVPTFIFYRGDDELGRIVEYPIESMEADMVKILSGQPYRHAYDWD